MDLLLELVRLAHLCVDDTDRCTTRGDQKDKLQRTYNLWSTPADKAAKELRNAARKKTGKPAVALPMTVS